MQSDNLRSYIAFFQSQLAKVPNCLEDVSALVFISGLQVSHSLYKHLLKYNVTRMSEVLSRAQPYIQLEEAMYTSFNHTAKHGDIRVTLKSPHEASAHTQDRNRGQPAFKRQALLILSPSPLRAFRTEEYFTPFRLSINEIFNTIKDQSWVRRPKPIRYDPTLPKAENIAPTVTARDT